MTNENANDNPISNFDKNKLGIVVNNQSNDTNKTPKNLEAEQGLIGSILFDNTVLETIVDITRDYHFYDPLHKDIFIACLNLFEKGNIADPITLNAYLKDRNLSRKQDISKYLNQLQDGALSVSSAKNYAVEIKNCYVRRSLIKISDEIINQSINPKIKNDPDYQNTHAEEILFNLAEIDKTETGPKDFKSTLQSATKLIDEAFKRGTGLPGVDTGFQD